MKTFRQFVEEVAHAPKGGATKDGKTYKGGQFVPKHIFTVYHGSPNDFNKFEMVKAGSTTDPGALGRGLYFSDDPRVTDDHRFKTAYQVELNLKNPLVLEMADQRTRKIDLVSRALGIDPPTKETFSGWSEKVRELAMAKGHDGIVLDYAKSGYNGKEFAVFDANAITIKKKQSEPFARYPK